MCVLHEGIIVDPRRPGEVVQDASPRVLVAIHGLCLNEQHWVRDGHHRIAATAAATGHTIVYLRYNSGRSIDANGVSLAFAPAPRRSFVKHTLIGLTLMGLAGLLALEIGRAHV